MKPMNGDHKNMPHFHFLSGAHHPGEGTVAHEEQEEHIDDSHAHDTANVVQRRLAAKPQEDVLTNFSQDLHQTSSFKPLTHNQITELHAG